jgi:tetratricopeptide (TPR) repeat protein
MFARCHLPCVHRVSVGRVIVALGLAWCAPTARAGEGPAKPLPSISQKTSEALVKLRTLQEAKDWGGIHALLDGLAEVKPGSYDEAVILDVRARTFGLMEQGAKAIAPWERALQVSDDNGYFGERQTLEIVLLLAQLRTQQAFATKDAPEQARHFTAASAHFDRYLRKFPAPAPEVMMNYATVLYHQATADPNRVDAGLLRAARELTDRGLKASIRPREGFYQLKLAVLQQENDYAGASDLIELLVHQKPESKDYWQALMQIYVQLSEPAKTSEPALARQYLVRAIVTYERAQAHGFLNSPKQNLHLASLHFLANQFTQGTELLYRGMKNGTIESEPNNWRLLGRFYQEANQNPQAIAVLEEGITLFPANGELEMQLAHLHYQLEQNAAALTHAKAAAAKGNFETTKPFAVFYLIAYTAFDLGRLEDAQQAIASAEKFPEEVNREAQFSKLKSVIADTIAQREPRTAARP